MSIVDVTEEQIARFKELYRSHLRVELTDDEARREAEDLFWLVRCLLELD